MSIFSRATRPYPIEPVVTQSYSRRPVRCAEPVVDPDAPTEWDEDAETIPHAPSWDAPSMTLPPLTVSF